MNIIVEGETITYQKMYQNKYNGCWNKSGKRESTLKELELMELNFEVRPNALFENYKWRLEEIIRKSHGVGQLQYQ